MHWLKHAFAVDSPAAFQPTADEEQLVTRLAVELHRRQLTLPATVLLESFRPLGSIAAQGIWFSYPLFGMFMDPAGLKRLGQLLERPGSVDWILDRLSGLDAGVTASPPEERP